MHSVLLLPELLEQILDFGDTSDLRRDSVVCRVWSHSAQRLLLSRPRRLRSLIASLPEDLIGPLTQDGIAGLDVYSNATPREDLIPLELSALLPHYYRIIGNNVAPREEAPIPVQQEAALPEGDAGVEANEETGSSAEDVEEPQAESGPDAEPGEIEESTGGGDDEDEEAEAEEDASTEMPFVHVVEPTDDTPQLNFMNDPYFDPEPMSNQLPAPRLDITPKPYQFVKIFLRPVTEPDLIILLVHTSQCRHLIYTAQDAKAFLVLHALERLFPSIDFFPQLKEMSIITSPLIEDDWISRDAPTNLSIPFSLLRRARLLTLEHRIYGYQQLNGRSVWASSLSAVLRSVDNLPQGALDRLIELRQITSFVTLENSPEVPDELDSPDRMEYLIIRLSNQLKVLQLPGALSLPAYVGAFAHLEELILGQVSGNAWISARERDMFGPPLFAIEFTSLRSLKCRGCAISYGLLLVLERGEFPQLTHLTIEHTRESPTTDTSSILQIIGQRLFHLEHLHVDMSTWGSTTDVPSDDPPVLTDVFSLFGGLSNLSHLHYTCRPRNERLKGLDDDNIAKIPQIWPRLTDLSLDPLHSPYSTVTLDSLVLLAKCSPKLVSLALALDPNTVHAVFASGLYRGQFDGPSLSAISKLDIGLPAFRDSTAAVDCLRVLFPRLYDLNIPDRSSAGADAGRIFQLLKVKEMLRARHPTKLAEATDGDEGATYHINDAGVFLAGIEDDDDADYFYDSQEDEEENKAMFSDDSE